MAYSLYLRREPAVIRAELEPLGVLEDTRFEFEGISLWSDSGEWEYRGMQEVELPRLLSLAARLQARWVGDDGEVYPASPQARRAPGLWQKAQAWLDEKLHPPVGSFRVGDRVRDVVSGREAVVVRLQGGSLPKVTVRFADGRESKRALDGSGLDRLEPQAEPSTS